MSKFCESTYEEAFVQLLEENGWEYTCAPLLHVSARSARLNTTLCLFVEINIPDDRGFAFEEDTRAAESLQHNPWSAPGANYGITRVCHFIF